MYFLWFLGSTQCRHCKPDLVDKAAGILRAGIQSVRARLCHRRRCPIDCVGGLNDCARLHEMHLPQWDQRPLLENRFIRIETAETTQRSGARFQPGIGR
ncbi:MAG: hypothetical protein QOG73_1901 [Acetobacteraceae bacterium]|jgi:hypothetical protein|nr:hypothetical protein [Acetobacteraceae bacterium]